MITISSMAISPEEFDKFLRGIAPVGPEKHYGRSFFRVNSFSDETDCKLTKLRRIGNVQAMHQKNFEKAKNDRTAEN